MQGIFGSGHLISVWGHLMHFAHSFHPHFMGALHGYHGAVTLLDNQPKNKNFVALEILS